MLKRLSVTNNVARLRVPCSVVTMVMNEVSYDVIGVANKPYGSGSVPSGIESRTVSLAEIQGIAFRPHDKGAK